MNKIKTRKNWEALQSAGETIDLSGRMKRGLLSKAKKQAEYSDAPEPGVRRMRATIPVGQSQCSGQ